MNKFGFNVLRMMMAVLVFMGISIVMVNWIMLARIENDIKNTAYKSVQELQKSIDGDKLEKISKDKTNNSTEYKELLSSMSTAKAKSAVRNFYTLMKVDGNKGKFLVDVSVDASDFLEDYEMDSYMLRAFNGEVAVTDSAATDTMVHIYLLMHRSKMLPERLLLLKVLI